jgi:hypothetical protein
MTMLGGWFGELYVPSKIFAPAVPSDLLQAPMFLNVVALTIWLLVKGVDTGTQHP